MHWYKFNIADWSLATLHLPLLEEAVYFRLLNYYYDTERPIPLETQQVARRLRLEDHHDSVVRILEEFFVKTENGFTHRRCDFELKEYKKQAKKSRENGAKGGRPKNGAASRVSQKKPSRFPAGSQQEPSSNPAVTLTTNQEPLTTNQQPTTKEFTAYAGTLCLSFESWPAMPKHQTLVDWIAMRKRIKADVSQTVVDQFGKQLHLAAEAGVSVDDCLAECITSNWRGFKFSWLKNQERSYAQSQFPVRQSRSEQNESAFRSYLADLDREEAAGGDGVAGLIESQAGVGSGR